jgi:hypothetical protein
MAPALLLDIRGRAERMIDRRFFLKMTGLVAAVSVLDVLPVAAQEYPDDLPGAARPGPEALPQPPGTYQITGRVRLNAPLVEISGITNAQQISWSGAGWTAAPVASFTSFEHFDAPWRMPEINVRGGRLESLAVVPIDLG